MQGANVIALSRTHAKGDVLLQKGADFVIATKEDDVTAKLLEITNGKGVNLVFDPLGGQRSSKNYQRNDTRRQIHHLRCIKPR
ncbi:zinc-binding dehydrogenase [Haemophilus influenzae]